MGEFYAQTSFGFLSTFISAVMAIFAYWLPFSPGLILATVVVVLLILYTMGKSTMCSLGTQHVLCNQTALHYQ